MIDIEETEPAPEGTVNIDVEEPTCPDPEIMCPERDDGMQLLHETGELEPSTEDMKELVVDILTDSPLPPGYDSTFDIDFEKVSTGNLGTVGSDDHGCPCRNKPKDKFVPSTINIAEPVIEPAPKAPEPDVVIVEQEADPPVLACPKHEITLELEKDCGVTPQATL